MALENGFFIIDGFVSQTQMQIDGYKVVNLPIQTDQINGRDWIRPGNEADVVKPASLVDSISGRRFPYGGNVFTWPMVNLSPKMTLFLHETIFDLNWYSDVTVQTFNRATGNWEAYHATARWPDYVNEAELAGGGFNNFKLSFVNAIAAPVGPNLVTAGSASGNFVTGGTGSYFVDISNIGDDVTFSAVQIDAEIVSEIDFVSQNSPGWTAFWSLNNTTFTDFDVQTPIDLSAVRYLRWTRSDVLSSNAAFDTITLNLNFPSEGSFNTVFTITSTSDSDNTDNSITFSVDISNSPFDAGFDAGFGASESGFSTAFDTGFGITSENGFDSGFSNGFGAVPA